MHILQELNEKFPIRRTDEEKQAFRAFLTEYAGRKGVAVKTEQTSDGKNQNVVIGNADTAQVFLSAHYDTPARALFPNLMIPRNKPLFFLFQFLPVILMLAIALPIAYLVGVEWLNDTRIYFLTFLVLYYVLFFLFFRGGKNPHNYNDNTSGVATLLAVLDRLSEEEKQRTCLLFFDNEEKGKKGSKAYCADHPQMQDKLLVNFDCVANGEHIVFIAKEQAEQKPEYTLLKQAFKNVEPYTVAFYPMRGSESNSDYKNFSCGVGCMVCRKTKNGVLYTPYIHTVKDVVANADTVDLLADKTTKFIKALS